MPSVLPGFEGYPHAPWWADTAAVAQESRSFLTLGFAAALHRAGVAGDDSLQRATDWSWRSIESSDPPRGYRLKCALAFLDAVPDDQRACAAIDSSEQQPDGGWMFDWREWSPAQTNDWRGSVTIRALLWLRDNGRL